MSGADFSTTPLDVSRETIAKLSEFVETLVKWNGKINLIGRATEAQIWERHIQDSVQIFGLRPKGAQVWADLGSGGGLPGIVVGIMLAEAEPQCQLHLVESDARKATFLREAARVLGLTAEVHNERIEKLPSMNADIVSARALAPLGDLCGFAAHHMVRGGTAIFPKGETWENEVALAKKDWTFELQSTASTTSSRSAVLQLKDINHV